MVVHPVAYRYALGEPNKSQHYGLGSALTTMRHLPPMSRGSTSHHADDVGYDASTMSQISQFDEFLLCRFEDLETCEQDRQTRIPRMREKMREKAEALDHQLTQLLDKKV